MADDSDKQREELLEAFSYGDKEKALTLLNNTEKPGEIKGSSNLTLLHHAAANGWADVCQLLVELYQTDPHAKVSGSGETALHYACRRNRTDTTVKYLVSHAHCDPLIEDNYGRTPFYYSKGESRDFLQDIIDKAKKEGLTVVEYTKSVSSHGRNHPVIDYTPYLERAAAQGTVTTRLSSIGLFGAAGTGKSSTARLLTDQEPVYEHDSTAVMKPQEYYKATEDGVRAARQDVLISKGDEIKEWMPATQDVLIERFSNCVATLAAQQQAGTAQGASSIANCLLIEGFSMDKNKAEVQPISSVGGEKAGASATNHTASATQQNDPLACVSNVTQSILNFVKSREDLQKLGITHFVSLCDTGGQAAFLDIAPALLSFYSVNLVLLKLNEKLNDPAKFFYSVRGQTVGHEKRQITTRQLVYSMVSCKSKIMPIATRVKVKSTEGSKKPMFMILGTHLDEYKKMKACSGNFESEADKNSLLESDLEAFKDFMLPNEDTMIFSVDTRARDEETKQLASEIRELVMESYIEVEIPASWYIFHLAMLEIKQSGNESYGMISLSVLNGVGIKLAQMPPKEVQAALQYFHVLRISLYFPTVASNVVFTDPQFLFDKISEIFAFSQGKGKLGVTREDLKKLKENGKFSKNLLQKICKGFNENFSQREFLSLLNYLFIVSEIPDTGEYFMPSLLAEHPKPFADLLANSQSSPSIEPLLLSWDSVPNGLFTSLTTSIQAAEGVNKHRFTMSPSVEQYRNRITLDCTNLACQVTLIECAAFVALQVLRSKVVANQCIEVRRAVLSCVGKIGEKFNWMPSLANPEEAFLCKIEQCTSRDDIHFCHLDTVSRKVLSCSKSSLITADAQTDAHLVWWDELDSSLNQLTTLNMFNLLQDKASRWSDIGRAFGISDDYRETLRHNPALSDNDRLEKVLDKWLESTSDRTWARFRKVLTDQLEFNDVAERVKI